jgi:hypothetical protein
MNKLQLRAVRPRTTSTFHRRKASCGMLRTHRALPATILHHDTPVRRDTPLRAQWFRNTQTSALECRWVVDATAEPPVQTHRVIHAPRRISRVGLRPPSR